MNNEQAFILPFVLFVIALTFMLITTNVQQYQSNISMTKNQLQQITIETLIQTAREKLKEKLNEDINNISPRTFHLPQGDVRIQLTDIGKSSYRILYIVTIQESKYTTIGYLAIPNKKE
ncbi:hypothetical protein [Virgibacillus salexigens]|uniref:ComG operon protein 7 n=1 Tax=Virgibacillus massiliensis TaxID=1462526 RepID=A0A024QAZ9_9BACI|nr:hypothetical protein [Virgibacillus massiliensis]CDQ39669.1 hypothetical protein BN990_01981 [Virgibacillus massiliensis]